MAYYRFAAVTFGAFVLNASYMASQTVSGLRRPAADVLADFEKVAPEKAIVPDEIGYPERYSVARVDSVVTGLERIAETSRSTRLAVSATLALMGGDAADRTSVGLFDRAMHVYKSRDNRSVRSMILGLLPQGRKDRGRILVFLKSVAKQSGNQRDYEKAPLDAAVSLSHMGREGRAVLSELRAKNLIQDPRANGFVYAFLDKR
jgi:hypothetical protein